MVDFQPFCRRETTLRASCLLSSKPSRQGVYKSPTVDWNPTEQAGKAFLTVPSIASELSSLNVYNVGKSKTLTFNGVYEVIY